MAKVKVLVEGYYFEEPKDRAKARATVSLIYDKDTVMVVDPGTLEDQQILIEALKKEGLTVNDITMVGITHSHVDHYRNVGMFPKAKVLEYWGLWDGVAWGAFEENFSKDIKVLKTPGHDYSCITFFVTTDNGVVAVCGDVFFNEDGPNQDPFATDSKKLDESRKLIVTTSDWIIPGHAPIYKVKK